MGYQARIFCPIMRRIITITQLNSTSDRCLTANKFNLDVDPVAVVCQAKEIVRRTERLYDQVIK